MYWAITHAEGFYRDIFKKFKGAFERIFITGVSPVTLDDVTSGFNIGWHISTKEEFNQMLGFSTEDVREIFTYYQEKEMIPADRDIEAIINEMKKSAGNNPVMQNALDMAEKHDSKGLENLARNLFVVTASKGINQIKTKQQKTSQKT